jgi:hypothetical protein
VGERNFHKFPKAPTPRHGQWREMNKGGEGVLSGRVKGLGDCTVPGSSKGWMWRAKAPKFEFELLPSLLPPVASGPSSLQLLVATHPQRKQVRHARRGRRLGPVLMHVCVFVN